MKKFFKIISLCMVLTVILCIILVTATTTNAASNLNYNEPNNSLKAATWYNISEQAIWSFINPKGDVDYYWFNCTENSKQILVQMYPPTAADFDVELLDSKGNLIYRSNNYDSQSEEILRTLNKGKYYVKVFGWNGAISKDGYILRITDDMSWK